jgi:hypothetical protein
MISAASRRSCRTTKRPGTNLPNRRVPPMEKGVTIVRAVGVGVAGVEADDPKGRMLPPETISVAPPTTLKSPRSRTT